MYKVLVIVALIGFASAGNIPQPEYGLPAAPSAEYGEPVAAAVAAPVAEVSPVLEQKPAQQYGQQIPAAAIRNLEKVEVTKTITPVVTKTTTHQTHSEPALSVGHVQGYTQTTVGEPKFADVQYNTVYTQYLNPTVGVNGPVTYSGPAVSEGVAVSQGYAVSPVAQYAVAAAPVAKVAAPAHFAYAAHGYAPAPLAAAPVAKVAPANFAYAAHGYAPAPLAAAPVAKVAPANFAYAAPASFLSSLYSVSPAYFGGFANFAAPQAFGYAAAPAAKVAAPEAVGYAAPVAKFGPAAGVPAALSDASGLLAASGYQGFFA